MVLGVADSMGDVGVRGGSVVVGGGIPCLDGVEDGADGGGGGDCDEVTAQRDEEKVQDAKSKSEEAGRDIVKKTDRWSDLIREAYCWLNLSPTHN